ncbi:MAG: DM13 domain-containing protein [Frankia sp.]|nr:DM13 domain-containing protein [Frankia sp.]
MSRQPAPAEPTTSRASRPTKSLPAVLRSAPFAGVDHRASGMAGLVRLADGRIVLRFEDLDVDNAPDMHVYLVRGRDRQKPDGGQYLGKLKANRGDQNYNVRGDVDRTGDVTALIWCRAFAVPIANATLTSR